MQPGTYTLVVALDESATVTFGAAGDRDLAAGHYAYTGSAFGPGGLSRVDRHRDLAAGERDTRHWHVDYLLGHPDSRLVEAHTVENADRECEIARALVGTLTPVPGLGASDCDCDTHLAYAAAREELERALAGLY
ncbi:GIY-YIG nuclease family protein [Salarchaeum sp. III]|uniref:GIY-YIG nuclease family protein n=1 Tax=Salarchaeum sp. III TaxID=3107927 RepID=UPI002ED7F1AD